MLELIVVLGLATLGNLVLFVRGLYLDSRQTLVIAQLHAHADELNKKAAEYNRLVMDEMSRQGIANIVKVTRPS